jgi:hypothetical protein
MNSFNCLELLKQIVSKTRDERLEELKKAIEEHETTLRALKNEIIDIRSGAKDSALANDPEYADAVAAMEAEVMEEPTEGIVSIYTN